MPVRRESPCSLAQELLRSRDPLLRISAVRALQQLPPPQRYASLRAADRRPGEWGQAGGGGSALAAVPLDAVG
jgi:hypothetical protein